MESAVDFEKKNALLLAAAERQAAGNESKGKKKKVGVPKELAAAAKRAAAGQEPKRHGRKVLPKAQDQGTASAGAASTDSDGGDDVGSHLWEVRIMICFCIHPEECKVAKHRHRVYSQCSINSCHSMRPGALCDRQSPTSSAPLHLNWQVEAFRSCASTGCRRALKAKCAWWLAASPNVMGHGATWALMLIPACAHRCCCLLLCPSYGLVEPELAVLL